MSTMIIIIITNNNNNHNKNNNNMHNNHNHDNSNNNNQINNHKNPKSVLNILPSASQGIGGRWCHPTLGVPRHSEWRRGGGRRHTVLSVLRKAEWDHRPTSHAWKGRNKPAPQIHPPMSSPETTITHKILHIYIYIYK